MGRDQRANEEAKRQYAESLRAARADAWKAMSKALAMLTGSLAVSVVVTEYRDEDGQPTGETKQFTSSLSHPDVGLAHMSKGAELLYDAHERTVEHLQKQKHERLQKEAEGLPMPGEDDQADGSAEPTESNRKCPECGYVTSGPVCGNCGTEEPQGGES